MENTETVRASSYWIKKIPKYIGGDNELPSNSQFVTSAIKEKIERIEERKIEEERLRKLKKSRKLEKKKK